MASDLSATRAVASRVAAHLVGKGQRAEAIEILTVWASAANDAEGHGLLAEALRHDPGHALAKAAFSTMEGIGQDPALEAARAKWPASAIEALDKEQRKPPAGGWQAEVGYNNNVKYKDHVYHIQTEDSGAKRPHIITHLFADGGRILKSFKRSYAEHAMLTGTALSDIVRGWMKGQHKEMFILLRSGALDGVIAGKEKGGMEERFGAPDPDALMKKDGKAEAKPAEAAAPAPPPVVAAEPVRPSAPVVPQLPIRARLHVIRALGDGPVLHEIRGDDVTLGKSADVVVVGDRFVSDAHARLRFRDGKLELEDAGSFNGTYLRIRQPVELEWGDTFIAGDQLMIVQQNPTPNDGPDAYPTYFYSSPKWPTTFRVSQAWEGGASGMTVVARGSTVQVGRAYSDLCFPNDFWLNDAHCLVEDQGGFIMLTDLGSRGGTFVKVKEPTRLVTGDEILVGRTRLRVELVQRQSQASA